jgi:exodeoxyribonuclease VII large subunit
MISTIKRRFPLTGMIVYPTQVQGETAKASIARNIERADTHPEVDLIIVGRGGGSIEDLWAFNERIVADAIYHAKTPIISAVGHETDFTIADFVADLRAPTPTGAAEMAVPDQHEIKRMLEKTQVQLKRALSQRLDRQEETLSYLLNHPVFRYPLRLIDPFEKALTHLSHRLSKQTPIDRVERLLETFKTQKKALNHAFESRLKTLEFRLESRTQSIKLNSPQTRLEQGYTLIQKDGKLIKRAAELTAGDTVDITFADGTKRADISQKGDS